MTDKLMPKNADIFNCKKCHFKCSKKSNFSKHLLTSKHINTDKPLTNTDAKNFKNRQASALLEQRTS